MPNGHEPTLLTDCECSLPVTELKNCIRFSQFMVFPAAASGKKPSYLTLKLPEVEIFGRPVNEFAEAAAALAEHQWTEFFRLEPADRKRRKAKRRGRRSAGLLHFPPPATEDMIPAARASVIASIKNKHAPGDYAAWSSKHPLIGLCAVFEQCWEVLGYTRGELVSSISLAPGEQVVLEYHTWDKSTFKSEEELTEELEQRLTSKLTQRDSQELVSELATQSGAKLSENLSLSIPIPAGDIVIPLGVNAGGELSNQLNTKLTGTLGSVRERTEEAALTLKNQHKVRVEVTRETGRDSKQTRTIANTNRCHTLNCHYFEILSNYRLRTKVRRLAPCVLVNVPAPAFTRDFVLCHEDILRKVLIDPIFLPGFAAAKLLETAAALEALSPAASSPAPGGGGGGGNAPAVGPFNSLRTSILDAWGELQDAVDTMEDAVRTLTAFNLNVVAKEQAAEDLADSIFKGFYLALLAANQDAYNAVETLDSTKGSVDGLEGLRRMFASVTHRDYQYTVVKAALAEGLDALGLPEGVVDFLLTVSNLSPILGINSLAEMVADDAGLHVAVKAAEDRIKEATNSPAGNVAAGLEVLNPIAPAGKSPGTGISLLKLAEAHVEFARLKCHLNDYKSHYLQAIWLRTHPDEKARFLADRGLGALTTGELLGFIDNKAAYALSNPDLFRGAIDVRDVLKDLQDNVARASDLNIQLPTGGTTLEAFLGCCDGCEDFIQKSRETELRAGEARAEQEEAEAERRRARLASDPQKLEEFVSPAGGSLTVKVEGVPPGD